MWVALIICMEPTGWVCGMAAKRDLPSLAACQSFGRVIQAQMDRPVIVRCVQPDEATHGTES